MSFNEKAFWENRTKIYLEETKNLHKWSGDKTFIIKERITEVEEELEQARDKAKNRQDDLCLLKVVYNRFKREENYRARLTIKCLSSMSRG